MSGAFACLLGSCPVARAARKAQNQKPRKFSAIAPKVYYHPTTGIFAIKRSQALADKDAAFFNSFSYRNSLR